MVHMAPKEMPARHASSLPQAPAPCTRRASAMQRTLTLPSWAYLIHPTQTTGIGLAAAKVVINTACASRTSTSMATTSRECTQTTSVIKLIQSSLSALSEGVLRNSCDSEPSSYAWTLLIVSRYVHGHFKPAWT